jgi:predicted metal-dependent hydrolase
VEPVPDEPLPAAQTIALATRLLDEGRPFAAHEVFETRWKDAPAHEGDLWQGLAQLCVAITHAMRGNPVGAERLLQRGSQRLAEYRASSEHTYGLDLDGWTARAQAAVEAATPSVR